MSGLLLLLLSVCVTLASSSPIIHNKQLPRWATYQTPTDLIVEQGYEAELHHCWTSDQFELGIHRILPKNGTTLGVVLMAHGIMANAGCWVANFPQNTLAFMLSDAGFDVWLLNYRGTKYSYYSALYTDKDEDFWRWGPTEMGELDLPAAVSYVLNYTGFKKLTLIAHSEGAGGTITSLSSQAYVRESVGLWMPLAPAAYISNTKSPALIIPDKVHLDDILYALHIWNIPALSEWEDIMLGDFCIVFPDICELAIEMVFGWDVSNCNASRVDVYLGQTDGTSTHNLQHIFQVMDTGQMSLFDYGPEKNVELYGTTPPPVYDFSYIDVPTAMFYGGKDSIVDQYDVETYLLPSLVNVQWVIPPVLVAQWNHFDFVFSDDGAIFEYMTQLVLQYGPRE